MSENTFTKKMPALSLAGLVLATSMLSMAPASAADLAPDSLTSVSVNTEGDLDANGVFSSQETMHFEFDFEMPADAEAGDTLKVSMAQPYYAHFTGALELSTDDGAVVATVEKDPDNVRGFVVTVTEAGAALDSASASASIPFKMNHTRDQASQPFEVTYSVNGGDFEGTGTVLNAPAASYYSTGTILYPSANADGSVNLYAVGFADASTSDSVRDVTMVFTPASDNWEFNTGWTLDGSRIYTDVNPDEDEIPGGSTQWEHEFGSNAELVSVAPDRVELVVRDVPAGHALRVQLPDESGRGTIDGNPFVVDTVVTGADTPRSGETISDDALPVTLDGSATGVLLINPAATDDAATTEANTPVTLDVLANDEIRQEGATFSDVKLTDDAGERVDEVTVDEGVFTVGEDNRITFTPTEGFHGQVPPIEYVAFDSNGKVAFADVVITVNAVVPTAVADEVETGHGEAVTIPVLDNDELGNDGDAWEKVELIDTEGNPVTELVTDEGTFTVNEDNTVTFTPGDDFSGEVPEVPYRATDSNGNSAESTVTVTVNEAPEAPVTAIPDANPDSVSTEHATPVEIDVLDNDELPRGSQWTDVKLVDPEGNPVDELVTDAGAFSVNDENIVTFTPADDFSGKVPAVTYQAIDDQGNTVESLILVNVGEPGEQAPAPTPAPDANPDEVTTEEGTEVVIDVLENDELPRGSQWTDVKLVDPEGNPVDELVTDEGTFTVNDDNTVAFTPAEGFTGDVPQVTYQVTDDQGNTMESRIKVTVTEAAETPAEEPSEQPTEEPTGDPTDSPSEQPTEEPSGEPTDEPSEAPVDEPTDDGVAPADDDDQDPAPGAPADNVDKDDPANLPAGSDDTGNEAPAKDADRGVLVNTGIASEDGGIGTTGIVLMGLGALAAIGAAVLGVRRLSTNE